MGNSMVRKKKGSWYEQKKKWKDVAEIIGDYGDALKKWRWMFIILKVSMIGYGLAKLMS